jgi:Na+-transporting methylmalonyl-CoA/oxaloacetate decarboxylase gamma subunit
MLVWLLVLLLLVSLVYVVYRFNLQKVKPKIKKDDKHHYTFKI